MNEEKPPLPVEILARNADNEFEPLQVDANGRLKCVCTECGKKFNAPQTIIIYDK